MWVVFHRGIFYQKYLGTSLNKVNIDIKMLKTILSYLNNFNYSPFPPRTRYRFDASFTDCAGRKDVA